MQPTKSVNTVIMAKAHPLGGGRGNMYKVLGSYDWNEQVIAKATCDWADVCVTGGQEPLSDCVAPELEFLGCLLRAQTELTELRLTVRWSSW